MSACCPTCGLAAPSSVVLGMTTRQRDLLKYLEQSARDGVSPTFDEMGLALGLTSKSSIARLVEGLEERGYIRRPFKRARSIVVIGRFDLQAVA